MGLDVVEMVMRVEEEFDIAIEDEEATFINTVGQLHNLILAKTGLLDPGRCQSSATFYRLRRSLVDLSVAPRRSLRPTTSIATLVPAANRRHIWKSWGENAGVKLPALEKPQWMRGGLWLILGLAMCVGPFYWNSSDSAVISYYIIFIAFCVLLYRWSELHAIHLPAGCATVGGVTKAVMKINYGINAEPRDAQNAEEVWRKLKAILVDELSVEPDEITPDAQFVRDLRLD